MSEKQTQKLAELGIAYHQREQARVQERESQQQIEKILKEYQELKEAEESEETTSDQDQA